jgi:hypothetical protein
MEFSFVESEFAPSPCMEFLTQEEYVSYNVCRHIYYLPPYQIYQYIWHVSSVIFIKPNAIHISGDGNIV